MKFARCVAASFPARKSAQLIKISSAPGTKELARTRRNKMNDHIFNNGKVFFPVKYCR